MGLWKDGKKWKYQFQYRGKLYGGGGYRTREQAETARAERRKEIKKLIRLTPSGMELSVAANLYLDFAQKNFVPKTYKYKKYVLDSFYSHAGDKNLHAITPEQITSYLETRPTNHNSNVHRKDLSAFFQYALEELKAISHNPVAQIKKMRESKSKPQFSPSGKQIQTLLSAARPHEAPLLNILVHTLARIDEILRLTWDDVDLQRNCIRLWTRKRTDGTLEYDELPMTQTARNVLLVLYEKRKQDVWVFFNNKTKTRYNRRPKFMARVCKRAKIQAFGFHRLRHGAASYLASVGVPIIVISALLRHKSRQTTEIYLHAEDGMLRSAIDKLETLSVAGPGSGNGGKREKKGVKGAKK